MYINNRQGIDFIGLHYFKSINSQTILRDSFCFFVINFDIFSSRGLDSLFNVLLKSPSVKIPIKDLFLITKETPNPLELISISVSERDVLEKL